MTIAPIGFKPATTLKAACAAFAKFVALTNCSRPPAAFTALIAPIAALIPLNAVVPAVTVTISGATMSVFAATQSNTLLSASAVCWITDGLSPPNEDTRFHTLLASGANADARFVAASHPDLSISQAAMPASRRLNRKSTRPLSSSRPKIGTEKFPLARTSQIP